MTETMLGRLALTLAAMSVAVAIICTSWPERTYTSPAPRPEHRGDSVFADILPRDNALIPALDTAYRDLELAMRPHDCVGCHAPNLATGNRRDRVRHAVMLLDTRRSLEAMLEANMMPPETDEHAAGIADEVQRGRLFHRVRTFRALADAALATW
jgi:hypothetical protein